MHGRNVFSNHTFGLNVSILGIIYQVNKLECQ